MIKNASLWQRHFWTITSKKNHLLLLAFTLLVFILNSCKKDIYSPAITETSGGKNPIKTISYSDFLQKVNLNQIGVLKTSFINAQSKSSGKLMSANSGISGFDIDTDSVKKLTLGDTVSYVISLKPETRHAIQFRNITIQTVNGQTIAFLTTYLPTQEFVKAWKTNKKTPFKGEILLTEFLLKLFQKLPCSTIKTKTQMARLWLQVLMKS